MTYLDYRTIVESLLLILILNKKYYKPVRNSKKFIYSHYKVLKLANKIGYYFFYNYNLFLSLL